MIVVGAGTLSGLLVMTFALRDKGEIPVPDIVGDEIVAALEKVTNEGLNLKITELAYDRKVPRNTVISQDPKTGSGLKLGRDVRVVISRGEEDLEMPDMRDLSLRQAKSMLNERGLPIPSFSEIYSRLEEGAIIAQAPPAGGRFANISHVELLVSKGPAPEKFLLPDYTGAQLSEVTDKIRNADLVLSRVRYVKRQYGDDQSILEQDPQAGRPVSPGQEVSLTVQKNTGELSSPRTFTLYNFTVPPTPKPVFVRVVVENMDGSKVIYKRSHGGGDKVSLLVQVAGATTLSIYVDDDLAEVKRF